MTDVTDTPNIRKRPRAGPQFEKWCAAHMVPGKCRSISQGARILAGNAVSLRDGTNTYLLGERSRGAGQPPTSRGIWKPSWRRPAPPFAGRCNTPPRSIAAEPPRPGTGAQIIGLPPPADGRQDTTFAPQYLPGDGECLSLGECRLTAIHTPGHASNCVCYLWERERLLFTGDHVLEGVSPVILPPDGDMSAYLHSLDKLQAHDFERIAPGHGGVMERGKEIVGALRAHRLAREEKVLNGLRRLQGATLDELVPVVYADVAPERHVWARLTLEAHLIKLARERRAGERDGVWRLSQP